MKRLLSIVAVLAVAFVPTVAFAASTGVGDVSSAMRYGASAPLGSVITDFPERDDATASFQAPFAVNFFGTVYGGLCVTTNGGVFLTEDSDADLDWTDESCSNDYDMDLENLADDASAPMIAAMANDQDLSKCNDESNDGFGDPCEVYYGTTTVDGRDAYAITWYRVQMYENRNDSTLSNTYQIVIVKTADWDGTSNWDFDIEFNFGQVKDVEDADGYDVNDGSDECSDAEDNCRWGIGWVNYDSSTTPATITSYELFPDTPAAQLADGGATSLTANSLNSSVAGRYTFGQRNGVTTNFSVPSMGGSGSPGESEPPCVARCNDDDEVVAVPPQPSVAAPGTVTRSTTPQEVTRSTTPQETVPRDGPVLRDGSTPRPSQVPQATLGGRVVPVVFEVTDDSRLEVSARAGLLSLGVQVPQDEGSVSQSDDGSTEITVRKGARTSLLGSGLRPESTVQVFLPLQGSNARELTRIPVGPDGTFSGDAVFATQPDEDPLPIGRQVLQLVSVDENGDEFVVDMTVNIAQPPPAPELNRVEGVIPTLTPGSSIATNAGVPEQVTVSAVEEQKLAVVEGDGWSMAIGVAAEDGGVQATDGGASLTLVRNEPARVSGDGFMPGTRADVWLFSEPTLLGTVTIDDEGRFDGEVNIDGRVIAVGNHTLQLQGVGEDGYVRAANMGVTVGDPAEVVPTAEENSLMFIWWVLAALVLIALVIVFWIAANRRRRA